MTRGVGGEYTPGMARPLRSVVSPPAAPRPWLSVGVGCARLVWLLPLVVACDPHGDDKDAASDTSGPVDTAAPDSGGTETGDTDQARDPRPGWAPTAAAPFVVESCGFDVGYGSPTVVPDQDGDGVDDLVITTDEPSIAGVWLVRSGEPATAFWASPVGWPVVPDPYGPGVRVWPDLDGDGVAELVAFTAEDEAVALLPGGSIGDVWVDAPTTVLPWRDVDGDGVDELVAVPPGEGVVRIVRAAGVDPGAWTALAEVSIPGLTGEAATVATGGVPDLLVDVEGGAVRLSGAALEASEAASVVVSYACTGRPVPLGDVDGGGSDDVAFESVRVGGPVQVCGGEAPELRLDVPLELEGSSATVGPDGAGGLAVWAAGGGVYRYAFGDVLAGRQVAEASTNTVLSWRVYASPTVVYAGVSALPDDRYTTRAALVRLDDATAAVTAEVLGGGPGEGGEALGAHVADFDGDGRAEWWQDEEGPVRTSAIEAGVTVSVCDLPPTDRPDWSAAAAGDVDGDGAKELLYWAEPNTVGVWSPAAGARWEGAFDGGLVPLGCDLDGDGVGELLLDGWEAYVVDGAELLTRPLAAAVLAPVRDGAVCVGDLDGDGIPEVADTLSDAQVYDGASILSGRPEVISVVEGPTIGRPVALGDADGDGLGDLGVLVSTDAVSGTCVVPGAWLTTRPSVDTATLEHCWSGTSAYWPVDLDRDGVSEVLRTDGAGGLVAWSLVTGAATTVWTEAADGREEPLLDVIPDVFGPGLPAIVLGPEPVVIYALGLE